MLAHHDVEYLMVIQNIVEEGVDTLLKATMNGYLLGKEKDVVQI